MVPCSYAIVVVATYQQTRLDAGAKELSELGAKGWRVDSVSVLSPDRVLYTLIRTSDPGFR